MEPALIGYSIVKHLMSAINFILSKFMVVVSVKMRKLTWKRESFVYGYDYIRFSSLELVAHEIYDKVIEGCCAELGVYRGNFAKNINKVFPDRKLYLFDTFEGFNEKDLGTENENNFSKSKKKYFSDTSVDLVLNKMKYPENCIIKKGYFPESITGGGG